MQELEELEFIIHSFLKYDKKFEDGFANLEKESLSENKTSMLSHYDNLFYSKYDYKTVNSNNLILYRTEIPSEETKTEDLLLKNIKKCKDMTQISLKLRNFLSIPTALQNRERKSSIKFLKTNESRQKSLNSSSNQQKTIEINSFFENESTFNSGLVNSSSFLSLKNLKHQITNESKKGLKSNGKQFYKEFSNEYKPKILTTNMCMIFELLPINLELMLSFFF